MFIIYVWPDNSWMDEHEYEDVEMSWAGDDFEIVTVPDEVEDIDEWLQTRRNN